MDIANTGIPQIDEDPVMQLLLSGRARTLYEAEEIHLDESLPKIVELLTSDMPEDALLRHPLIVLLRAHGSRGWEDSLL